jgi:hypothetical protein
MTPQMSVTFSHHVTELPLSPTRKTQTAVIRARITTAKRNFLYQYQARRRLTTSSSFSRFSSVPNRLGHGMKRRTPISTRPRVAMTMPNVAAIDQKSEKSCM